MEKSAPVVVVAEILDLNKIRCIAYPIFLVSGDYGNGKRHVR